MQRHFCFCFLFTPARDAKIQFSISISQISSFHVCAYLNNSYYYLSNELSIQKIVSYTALWMHILIMMSVSIRVLHRYFSVLLFFCPYGVNYFPSQIISGFRVKSQILAWSHLNCQAKKLSLFLWQSEYLWFLSFLFCSKVWKWRNSKYISYTK